MVSCCTKKIGVRPWHWVIVMVSPCSPSAYACTKKGVFELWTLVLASGTVVRFNSLLWTNVKRKRQLQAGPNKAERLGEMIATWLQKNSKFHSKSAKFCVNLEKCQILWLTGPWGPSWNAWCNSHLSELLFQTQANFAALVYTTLIFSRLSSQPWGLGGDMPVMAKWGSTLDELAFVPSLITSSILSKASH